MKQRKFATMAGYMTLFAMMIIFMTACSGNAAKNTDSGKAKYIFLFIGDGMGASQVAAAESYLSYKAGKIGGEQLTFTGFPVLGMATTYSANRHITCSSASGTAIACGTKTNNGYLGVDTEGNRLKSIAYTLKEEGYKIGIMSSVPINHATPASFYGHSISRNDYYSIAEEIPETGFEFFGGNGFIDYFGKDGNKPAITEYIENNGYNVCFGAKEYNTEKAGAEKIVFCQPSSKGADAGNYETEETGTPDDATLGEMVSTCLDFIGDGEPFFIMCEGGEIDWKAHANMTMAMIEDILDFNGAVDVAYSFYLKHPDETLILVTADHETGGIALGGKDGSKNGSSIYWDDIDKAGANISDKQNRELNLEANIGWTTNGHTGAPVPVYAIGKGAERFSGRMDNTEISSRILGIE